MQRGVLEVMFDECRTEIWVIDPGALCDTKLWLGKAGRIPSSTELDEYEYAGSGPMDVLMSVCLSARACRLWWFDELGAEYWSRRCDEVSYEKSATYNSIVASATNPPLQNNLIYSHSLPYTDVCIIPYISPLTSRETISQSPGREIISPQSDMEYISQPPTREMIPYRDTRDCVRTVMSVPPFTMEVAPITERKRRLYSFDRFMDLSEPPRASTVPPEVRDPVTPVPTMPQPPSMAYLAWLAFPERDTSPRACLCTSLPEHATLTTDTLSMDIPCRGDGVRNPLPRLCMVAADGVGPLAGVPFVIESN